MLSTYVFSDMKWLDGKIVEAITSYFVSCIISKKGK